MIAEMRTLFLWLYKIKSIKIYDLDYCPVAGFTSLYHSINLCVREMTHPRMISTLKSTAALLSQSATSATFDSTYLVRGLFSNDLLSKRSGAEKYVNSFLCSCREGL